MTYKNIKIPKKGSKVSFKDGKLVVPDNPIIPYIEGDGIGVDITPPMISVVNEAVKIAYNGKRKIEGILCKFKFFSLFRGPRESLVVPGDGRTEIKKTFFALF